MNKHTGSFYLIGILILGVALLPASAIAQQQEQHYLQYLEYLRNGELEQALPPLRWLLEHAPSYRVGDDRHFQRAIDLYERLLKQTDDPALREAYFREAVGLFDRVVPALAAHDIEVDTFEWVLHKGRFMQKHGQDYPDAHAALMESYRQAYALSPDRLDDYYLQVLVVGYAKEDKEVASRFMEELEQVYPERDSLRVFIEKVRLEM